MQNKSDNFFISQIMKKKTDLRLLCLCEKIKIDSVDYFGWYKCKKCKGHLHLKELTKKNIL